MTEYPLSNWFFIRYTVHKSCTIYSVKPGKPILQSLRLLDQVRERIRYLHYSLNTEKLYVHWVHEFVRWSGRGGNLRHPRELGA
jgi:hypothetical protein